MTNRILIPIKHFFISVEFAIVLIIGILYFLGIDLLFSKIYAFLFSSEKIEYLSMIFLVPSALFLFTIILYQKALAPDINKSKLYKWEKYKEYKHLTTIGLLWNFFTLVTTFLLVIYKQNIEESLIGAIYIAFCLASFFATSTIFFAKQKLIEIFERNK
jgi:hypothetical protein